MKKLLTPSEVKARNPRLAWTAQQIGWLYALGLVRGQRIHRGCLVDEDQVLQLSTQIID